MTTTDTLSYLKKVYELESSLYQQRALSNQIKRIINDINYDQKLVRAMNSNTSMNSSNIVDERIFLYEGLEKNSPYQRTQSTEIKSKLFYNIDGGVIGGFAFLGVVLALIICIIRCVNSGEVKLYRIFADSFWTTLFSSLGIGLIFGTIAFIVILAIYLCVKQIKTSNENRIIKGKNNIIRKNNDKIIAENNNKYKERQIYKKKLEKEYNYLTKTSIENTKNALEKIYSCNVIFKKYHKNFVAISSFYEYFASGRGSTLGEAYNKYEEELRLNLIITELDIIITKLEQIKNNQFMLYDAINKSNDTNKKILSTMKSIGNQNDDIMRNATITAYNSSITAQNTEYLKWYTFFRS